MVLVEKGGILVTSFLWLWILSHGNVLLAFLRSFYLNYLHLCPESLPDVHLIRACSVNLACGAAVLCLHHAGKESTTMPLNKTRKRSTACCCSSISPQAFVKATFFVIFIQDVYVLSNPIIIHNNTSLLHIFCSWHCHKCIGMISFIIH